MTTDHPVIKRALEIVTENGGDENESLDSRINARIDAVYRALSETTGMRMPVLCRDKEGDTTENKKYRTEFLRATLSECKLSALDVLDFGFEEEKS